MSTRKILPAMIGLLLPVAALIASPASAQNNVTKSHTSSHHAVHKVSHKTKTHHTSSTPKES